MYTFHFDRRSLALLVAGAVAAAALFFTWGVLVGLRLNLPAPPVGTAEFKTLSAFEGGLIAAAEPARLPTAPPAVAAEPDPERQAAAGGTESEASPDGGDGPYVQVGAFWGAVEAEKQLALLRSEGFRGYIAERRTDSGGSLHVVCFGRYPSLREAAADARKYLAGGPGREAVVRSPR